MENINKSTASYFNPFSKEHDALSHQPLLSGVTKSGIIAISLLMLPLFIVGGVATYRKLTELAVKNIKIEVSDKTTKKTDKIFQKNEKIWKDVALVKEDGKLFIVSKDSQKAKDGAISFKSKDLPTTLKENIGSLPRILQVNPFRKAIKTALSPKLSPKLSSNGTEILSTLFQDEDNQILSALLKEDDIVDSMILGLKQSTADQHPLNTILLSGKEGNIELFTENAKCQAYIEEQFKNGSALLGLFSEKNNPENIPNLIRNSVVKGGILACLDSLKSTLERERKQVFLRKLFEKGNEKAVAKLLEDPAIKEGVDGLLIGKRIPYGTLFGEGNLDQFNIFANQEPFSDHILSVPLLKNIFFENTDEQVMKDVIEILAKRNKSKLKGLVGAYEIQQLLLRDERFSKGLSVVMNNDDLRPAFLKNLKEKEVLKLSPENVALALKERIKEKKAEYFLNKFIADKNSKVLSAIFKQKDLQAPLESAIEAIFSRSGRMSNVNHILKMDRDVMEFFLKSPNFRKYVAKKLESKVMLFNLKKGKETALARTLYKVPEFSKTVAPFVFEIDKGHLAKIQEESVPEVKELVDIEKLVDRLKEVPIGEETGEGRLPVPRDEKGEAASKEVLETRLKEMVRIIKEREPYQAAPSKENSPEAFEKFYQHLENLLKHHALKVEELTKKAEAAESQDERILLLEERNRLLVDLAHRGHYCATRWKLESEFLYKQYHRSKTTEMGFEQELLSFLQKERVALVERIIDDLGQRDVHYYNLLFYDFSKEFGLPQTGEPDVYAAAIRNKNDVKTAFNSNYTPSQIVTWVRESVNGKGGISKEAAQDWLKENVPEDFQVKKWSGIARGVEQLRKEGKAEAAIFQDLEEVHGVGYSQKTLGQVTSAARQALFIEKTPIPDGWDLSLEPKAVWKRRAKPTSFQGLKTELEAVKSQETKEGDFQARGSQLLRKYGIDASTSEDPLEALEIARKTAYAKQKMPENWDTESKTFAALEKESASLTKTEDLRNLFRKHGVSQSALNQAFQNYQTPEELVQSERGLAYLESESNTETGALSEQAIRRLLASHGILSGP